MCANTKKINRKGTLRVLPRSVQDWPNFLISYVSLLFRASLTLTRCNTKCTHFMLINKLKNWTITSNNRDKDMKELK